MSYYDEKIELLTKAKEREERKNKIEEAASLLHETYNCLIKSGFTSEQAYELLLTTIKNV